MPRNSPQRPRAIANPETMSHIKLSEPYDSLPAPDIGTADAVARFPRNTRGRDFVVGDIHGMFDHLESLLSAVTFDAEADRLFSVGDLVDRGPASARALEWMAYPWFHAVRGNHEQFVLDSNNANQLDVWINHNGGTWWLDVGDAEREKFRRVFADMPVAMEIATDTGVVGIVHADVPPFITWERFLELLENRDPKTIFYSIWSRNRLSDYSVSKAVAGNVDRIYCGHTPTRGTVRIENVFYIDTGAVYALDGYAEARLTLVEISPARHREFSVLTRPPA
jgi:serine/threonine protein phosphatase 1